MSNVSTPFVEYKEEGNIKLREPTAEELAESELRRGALELLRKRAEAIQQEIAQLESECIHTVAYDIAGMPYDVRRCYACVPLLGLV